MVGVFTNKPILLDNSFVGVPSLLPFNPNILIEFCDEGLKYKKISTLSEEV
jgi:hypothetical protein